MWTVDNKLSSLETHATVSKEEVEDLGPKNVKKKTGADIVSCPARLFRFHHTSSSVWMPLRAPVGIRQLRHRFAKQIQAQLNCAQESKHHAKTNTTLLGKTSVQELCNHKYQG